MAGNNQTGDNSMIRIQDPSVNSTTRTHPRSLQEAFPRDPAWREHDSHGDDWDFEIIILEIALIVFTLVLTWLEK